MEVPLMSRTCLNCGKETNNPKFCSRSCSTIISNKNIPKRSVEGKCESCKCPIRSSRKYCKSCFHEVRDAKDITLQEAIYEKHHRSSAFALVRARARSSKKALEIKCCEKCGWQHHVEVCHKRPIADYPLTSLLSEINAEDNLLILCPNCHWLYDHSKG